MRSVKLCLLGFGNVNRRFVELLAEKERELARDHDLCLRISAIGTRHGSLVNAEGLPAGEVAARTEAGLPSPALPAPHLMAASRADVLVESTVMEEGGVIAARHIQTAFDLGLDVVTVNKGPVAWHFHRLDELAHEKGRRWRFEGAVADGMPVFNLLEFCLRSCRVHGFDAIFNATTNFIIAAVGEGRPFADALAQVQAEGYAEADASHDIDGLDAACKTAALANVAMNARITPDEIPRESIRGITPERVRGALAEGRRVCVLCSARRREQGAVEASVRLTELPLDHPLAPVRGSSLGVVLHTDLMGDVVVAEMAGHVLQTAYAVYGDLLTLHLRT